MAESEEPDSLTSGSLNASLAINALAVSRYAKPTASAREDNVGIGSILKGITLKKVIIIRRQSDF